jgi:hypothetical protein
MREKNIAKIAFLGSKKAGVSFDKLHDFKENFNWEEASYRPLLINICREENH